MSNDVIALPELAWDGTSKAVATLDRGGHEAVGVLLMRALQTSAETAADTSGVELVSTTMDVTADLSEGGTLTFETEVDRRTRTLVFLHGAAKRDGQAVMTATAVYRIG